MFLALLGCFPPTPEPSPSPEGGGTGETTPPCVVVDSRPLAADDATLGFSLDDWSALHAGEHVSRFEFWNGETAGLTVTISPAGTVELVDIESEDGPPDGITTSGLCPDFLAIPISIGLVTDDGAFDEAWVETLQIDDVAQAYFGGDLPSSELGGAYVPELVDPGSNSLFIQIFGQIRDGEFYGQIIEYESGNGSNQAEVGTWGDWPF
jgi:hypothetical protein